LIPANGLTAPRALGDCVEDFASWLNHDTLSSIKVLNSKLSLQGGWLDRRAKGLVVMTLDDTDFDLECDALNALTPADIPDPARPHVVVKGQKPVAWFESFAVAAAYARNHFAPETYAIGNPASVADFVPMFIVRHPMA
jgi:hypothetical protein